MAKKAAITKVLSCALVFVILMSVMPVSVFAVNDSNNSTGNASNRSNELVNSFIVNNSAEVMIPLFNNNITDNYRAWSEEDNRSGDCAPVPDADLPVIYLNDTQEGVLSSDSGNDTNIIILTDVSDGTRETVSALGCEVYVKIDDPCCVGYCVYVDGVYQFTEGQDGTPDGYCAFYVSAGTHTIKINKNGRSASKTNYFQCGNTYRWVSMPHCWCENDDHGDEVKFRGIVTEYSEGMTGGYWWDVKVDEWISGSMPCEIIRVRFGVIPDVPIGSYDLSIRIGDYVEAYGSVYPTECSVGLNGESYYIKKISSELLSINVWTDKSEYKIGETVTIYYQTNKKCTAKLTITKPDGGDVVYGPNEIPASTRSKSATAGHPTGKRTVVFEAWTGAEYKKATCYFDVVDEEECEVKFQGTVTSTKKPGDSRAANFICEAKIDEIIFEKYPYYQKGWIIDIIYKLPEEGDVPCGTYEQVEEEDKIEVYGFKLPILSGPQIHGEVVSLCGRSSYYLKKVDSKREPDLIILDISLSPPSPKNGDTVTFTVKIKNQGSKNAEGFYVCYYVDGSYYTRNYINSLSAGSTTTTSFTWTAESGSHSIKAYADCYDAIDESNEGNNEKSIIIEIGKKPVHNIDTGKDFATIQAAIDDSNTGHTITVDAGTYVENVEVTKSLTIKSTSGNPEDTIVQAADSDENVFTVTADNVNIDGFTIKGASYLWCSGIWLNSNNCIISNNTFEDNAIGIWTHPPSGTDNTIRNNNFASSSEKSPSTALCIEETGNKIYLNNFFIGTMGGGSYFSTLWNSPSPITYTYNGNTFTSYLGNYWDDYKDKYPSAKENDNTGIWDTPYEIDEDKDYYPLVETSDHYMIKIDEKKPDLVIESISWSPSSPKKGDTVTFYVEVKNQGSGDAGTSYVVFWAGVGYIPIHSSVPALSSGSNYTWTLTWPADKCGDRQVKAVADGDNHVAESDEGNNDRTATMNVVCPVEIKFTGILSSKDTPMGYTGYIFHINEILSGPQISGRIGILVWDSTIDPGESNFSSLKKGDRAEVYAVYLGKQHVPWSPKEEHVGSIVSDYKYYVKKLEQEPFTFVHLTDPHIGPYAFHKEPFHKGGMAVKVGRFTDFLEDIKSRELKLSFILNTGDIVEYDNPSLFKAYLGLIKNFAIPIYHMSGNHDRRDFLAFSTNLENYFKYIPSANPRGLVPLDDGQHDYMHHDYMFDKYGYRFIGLDSGHDYDPWALWKPDLKPEGSGLDEKQMKRLNEPDIRTYPKKIIFMHHPVINEVDEDDTEGVDPCKPLDNLCPAYGGNDACLAVNRCEFIEYCLDNNVDLVLTGHTHKDVNVKLHDVAKDHTTEFIQTRSTWEDTDDKHGYRIVEVKDEGIRHWPAETYSYVDDKEVIMFDKGKCVEDPKCVLYAPSAWGISVYRDKQHTGVTWGGVVERNIPRSYYTGYYEMFGSEGAPQVLVVYGDGSVKREFHPVSESRGVLTQASTTYSPFNISVRSYVDGKITEYRYDNVRLTDSSTAMIDSTSLAEPDYTMEIDDDGDGITDRKKEPDSIETIRETSLQLHTGWNLISLPLTPEDTDVLNVLNSVEGNWNSVWSYEGGNWKRYDLAGPDFLNTLTFMEPGKGYWLHMKSDDTLFIRGSEPTVKSIPLTAGWNLVGYNSLDSMPTTEAMKSVDGNWNSVWSYEAGRWKRYDLTGPDFLNTLTFMEPEKGYWLNMKSQDTWTLGA